MAGEAMSMHEYTIRMGRQFAALEEATASIPGDDLLAKVVGLVKDAKILKLAESAIFDIRSGAEHSSKLIEVIHSAVKWYQHQKREVLKASPTPAPPASKRCRCGHGDVNHLALAAGGYAECFDCKCEQFVDADHPSQCVCGHSRGGHGAKSRGGVSVCKYCGTTFGGYMDGCCPKCFWGGGIRWVPPVVPVAPTDTNSMCTCGHSLGDHGNGRIDTHCMHCESDGLMLCECQAFIATPRRANNAR